MMPAATRTAYLIVNFLIAGIWLINGLMCKVLDLVPRHRLIVGAILGAKHASFFTTVIGFLEIAMAIWIVSGLTPRVNVIIQLAIVGIMNIVEFIVVPELLLWGRLNAIFALLFLCVLWYNEFVLRSGKAVKQ
jgi:DoxX-like protein